MRPYSIVYRGVEAPVVRVYKGWCQIRYPDDTDVIAVAGVPATSIPDHLVHTTVSETTMFLSFPVRPTISARDFILVRQ